MMYRVSDVMMSISAWEPILGSTISQLYINDLPDVIYNVVTYTDTTLYTKCDKASDLWQ